VAASSAQQHSSRKQQQQPLAASALPAAQAASLQVTAEQRWASERQRLQQQAGQAQADEQRRQREDQRLNQQLQALLSAHQELLARMHYARHLVMVHGLRPWLSLVQHKQQQHQLASKLREWQLLLAAMLSFKHAVVIRWVAASGEGGHVNEPAVAVA
jgi:ERCC4-related helicase